MDGLATEIWDVADQVEFTADGKAIAFRGPWRQGRGPYAALLREFIALGDADDQAILDFARRNGPLWICEHGIPASHIRVVGSTTEEVADALGGHSQGELRRRLGGHRELIADWRALIGQAAAIARVAKHVRTSSAVPDHLWAQVESRSQSFDPANSKKGTESSDAPNDQWAEVQRRDRSSDPVTADQTEATQRFEATAARGWRDAAAERAWLSLERRRIQIAVQRWLDKHCLEAIRVDGFAGNALNNAPHAIRFTGPHPVNR